MSHTTQFFKLQKSFTKMPPLYNHSTKVTGLFLLKENVLEYSLPPCPMKKGWHVNNTQLSCVIFPPIFTPLIFILYTAKLTLFQLDFLGTLSPTNQNHGHTSLSKLRKLCKRRWKSPVHLTIEIS